MVPAQPVGIMAAGLPLSWNVATGCTIEAMPRGVTGKNPDRVLEVGGGLRGFWATSPVRQITPNHSAQDFIVADFLREGDRWRVCSWVDAMREEFRCTVDPDGDVVCD